MRAQGRHPQPAAGDGPLVPRGGGAGTGSGGAGRPSPRPAAAARPGHRARELPDHRAAGPVHPGGAPDVRAAGRRARQPPLCVEAAEGRAGERGAQGGARLGRVAHERRHGRHRHAQHLPELRRGADGHAGAGLLRVLRRARAPARPQAARGGRGEGRPPLARPQDSLQRAVCHGALRGRGRHGGPAGQREPREGGLHRPRGG
mmetsp:Transcript_12170/g.31173  ORF Transcript_12170/g.31173 Transcript_12170/m.31173 type:complete len:203 (+) Transcript_12170:477-1085(+)